MKEIRKKQNPFFAALDAAKEITSRRPQEEQPDEYKTLVAALKELAQESWQGLVWRLVNEVLEGQASLTALYAVARLARLLPVAHGTSAIRKVLDAGATFAELQGAGLAVIRVNGAGDKPYTVYHVGREALTEAAQYFRQPKTKNVEFARILGDFLREGERFRALRAAAQDKRESGKTGDEETV